MSPILKAINKIIAVVPERGIFHLSERNIQELF